MAVGRQDRLEGGGIPDQRQPFQQDRDRVLYSAEFRRLAGVTQVVGPGDGEVFHNRLTHSLKVAQVARRLVEMFLDRPDSRERAEAWGGIDPDVVETAALVHDLGHPPFGHAAEAELDRQVSRSIRERTGQAGAGYEGNAQSFRIVASLAVRREESSRGLDLTRATLNATLKYPCLWRDGTGKYGAYPSEAAAFAFARELQRPGYERECCIEAQIMDWADDIAYSVHDTEDFYRAGLIPLDRLAVNPAERDRFLAATMERRANRPFPDRDPRRVGQIFQRFCSLLRTREPFTGTRSQRAALQATSSALLSRFIQETQLCEPGPGRAGLDIPLEIQVQVELLKELTWVYVIDNPTLATQRHGQVRIIRGLFEVYLDAAERKNAALFPARFREEAEAVLHEVPRDSAALPRLAADTIAGLSDQQAMVLHQRLIGLAPGGLLDPIFP
jgi:dGTPase